MRNDIKIHLKSGGRIKLRYAKEEVSPDTYFDHLHDHAFHEVCIYLSGEMLHMANGKSFVLSRGDVFFCRAGDMHYAFSREPSVYERYALWMPVNAFSEIDGKTEFSVFNDPRFMRKNLFRIRDERQDDFFALLESIKPLIAQGRSADSLEAYGQVARIMAFINSEAKCSDVTDEAFAPAPDVPPIVSRAILYIRENIKLAGGVENLAEHFHMNRDYLSRVFHRYTGLTLHDYIINIKMHESKVMLSGGAGVTETAFACGFNSTSYFIRVFKSSTGMTPAEFRRSGINMVRGDE